MMRRPFGSAIAFLMVTAALLPAPRANASVIAGKPDVQYKLTLSDIKRNYTDFKIVKIFRYHRRYVVVQSRKATLADRFDLYDLVTGREYHLPVGPFNATLARIVNPNHFVFYADGTTAVSPNHAFPFIIECTRKNTSDEFDMTAYPRYMDVHQNVSFGDREPESATGISFTQDGLQIAFGPAEGDHGQFYAGSTWIPPTQTSYDPKQNQFVIQFKGTKIDDNLKITNDPPASIQSIQMGDTDSGSQLVIQLAQNVQYFNANVLWRSNGQVPVLQFSFLPDNVTFSPGGMVVFHNSDGEDVDHVLKPLFSSPAPPNSDS